MEPRIVVIAVLVGIFLSSCLALPVPVNGITSPSLGEDNRQEVPVHLLLNTKGRAEERLSTAGSKESVAETLIAIIERLLQFYRVYSRAVTPNVNTCDKKNEASVGSTKLGTIADDVKENRAKENVTRETTPVNPSAVNKEKNHVKEENPTEGSAKEDSSPVNLQEIDFNEDMSTKDSATEDPSPINLEEFDFNEETTAEKSTIV